MGHLKRKRSSPLQFEHFWPFFGLNTEKSTMVTIKVKTFGWCKKEHFLWDFTAKLKSSSVWDFRNTLGSSESIFICSACTISGKLFISIFHKLFPTISRNPFLTISDKLCIFLFPTGDAYRPRWGDTRSSFLLSHFEHFVQVKASSTLTNFVNQNTDLLKIPICWTWISKSQTNLRKWGIGDDAVGDIMHFFGAFFGQKMSPN